ncbi:polysaccharide export protein [bacterium]|nr:polysaccharide export protein [bacterium]
MNIATSLLVSTNTALYAKTLSNKLTALFAILLLACSSVAVAQDGQAQEGNYRLNAGDVISLFVWNEPDLAVDQLLVRPDGFISVPIVGEVKAGNNTIAELQRGISKKLSNYLRDEPTVVVSLVASQGSAIYVLGKVLRPGQFPLIGPMDVTQALALAVGLNQFAAENDVKVLRRDANGVQHAVRFRYGKVKTGDNLKSNILLRAGDVVVVP